ncbi:uncharacterized protein [Dermacentor albipictus]|uniref:uncharacterized protein n=1 Tax=Dermacentor albipictus TaxID=60249 RepID=UPI0031FDD46E
MASWPSTSAASMSKSSVSEASITSTGKVPTALLCCRLFRPKISGCGCALLVLCATGFVATVTINRGLVAWSSIFAAETVVPKGAIHQSGWSAVTRNTTASVPAVRRRRPVASHAGIAPAIHLHGRRRPRKVVAAAERVRVAKEETEEEVVPPVVVATTASGSDREASGPHRRRIARAQQRRSMTARSESPREPPNDADEIFSDQETPMPTDLSTVAETLQDDGDQNSDGTSSESDSGETTTEIISQETTVTWGSISENSSEPYSLTSEAVSMSPKFTSVADSKEETVDETKRMTGDSEHPKGHPPTGSIDTSASPQPPSSTVELLNFEKSPLPTKVIEEDEELPTNESSSTGSPFTFSSICQRATHELPGVRRRLQVPD